MDRFGDTQATAALSEPHQASMNEMSMSIEELDKTVRTFYEGRGDVVSSRTSGSGSPTNALPLAKTSAADDEPGTQHYLYGLRAHNGCRLTKQVVQGKPGLLAVGGQDTTRCYVSADEVQVPSNPALEVRS